MTRPITIPVGGPMQLGIDRLGMRRRVTTSLLRHGRDGVWGACYCGDRHSDRTDHHRRSAVAAETGLDRDYIDEVFAEHDFAAGHFCGEMRCKCTTTYIDRDYGAEQHLAEAVATGCSAEMLRAAYLARRAARAEVTRAANAALGTRQATPADELAAAEEWARLSLLGTVPSHLVTLLAEYDRRGAIEARTVKQVEHVLPYVPGPDPDDQGEDWHERVVAALHGRAVELEQQRTQLAGARALHTPYDGMVPPTCRTCVDADEEPTAWPCATAAALGATTTAPWTDPWGAKS